MTDKRWWESAPDQEGAEPVTTDVIESVTDAMLDGLRAELVRRGQMHLVEQLDVSRAVLDARERLKKERLS